MKFDIDNKKKLSYIIHREINIVEIKGNFKIDKYKISGFEKSENPNKVEMHLNNYLVCEFDKSKTYEFLVAMLGKDYMQNLGYNKTRFEDEYKGSEIAVLRGSFEGKVAFVLKDNAGLEDVVGITGVDDYDQLVAKNTDELFKDIEDLREDVETL